MIRLVRVELARLRWRRAILLLLVAAVIIPIVVLLVRAYDTRPVSDDDRAEARAQADQQRQFMQDDIDRCLQRPSEFGISPAKAERQCESRLTYPINPDDFLYRQQLVVVDERESSGLAVVAIVAILMLLGGTTYAGHDWNSGSMSNQLLFESRRLRVWTAKAIAIGLVALGVGLVALAVLWGGLLTFAQARGLEVTGQDVNDILQQAGRGLAMIVVGALGGYAITMLFRSTVFTIGVLLGVSVAGGVLFGALLPGSALRYEPATNALAVVNGQATWYVEPPADCNYGTAEFDSDRCLTEARLTQTGGAIYYGVGLLLLGAASAASYRRRDVP